MRVLQTDKVFLNEVESRKLLEQYGVSQNFYVFAKDGTDAVQKASELKFPLVMKVVSPKIVHKSDFGGVKTGLKDLDDVKNAYFEIVNNVQSRQVPLEDVEGVTIQEMVEGVGELLIGAKRDAIFGTVIVVGLGGLWVELMKDVSLGISPLNEQDIRRMITKLKGYPLINGYRGRPKGDIESIIEMVKKVESMVLSDRSILEIDLNPVIVRPMGHGAIAVDARILIKQE